MKQHERKPAQSHHHILNPKAPDYEEQYWALRRMGARFRVNHHSWWKQELPDKSEYEEARHSLESIHYEMDYVITHLSLIHI